MKSDFLDELKANPEAFYKLLRLPDPKEKSLRQKNDDLEEAADIIKEMLPYWNTTGERGYEKEQIEKRAKQFLDALSVQKTL